MAGQRSKPFGMKAISGGDQKPGERERMMRKSQWPPRYVAQRGWSGRLLAFAAGLLLWIAPVCAQDTLRIPYVADIGTFDPDNGFEIGALSAIDNVYEGLVEYQPGSTRIVGLLAKSWDVSDDGLTYTFHLVKGVRFQDGTPCDAAAVVKSFERRRDDKLALAYFLENVATMNTPDDMTVVLTLRHPQPSFLDDLSSPWGPKVISPTALAHHDNGDHATTWLNDHADGTGPFKLADFKRGERYVLERNEDYWGAKPYFRRILITLTPDIGQQILQLQAGDIDAVPKNYPFDQLNKLPPGIEITSIPSMAQYDLFVKPGTPLDDSTVRAAVLTAINPALWAKDVFGKYATLAKSIYPQTMLEPVHPITFPTDFEAAKAAIRNYGKVRLTIGLYSDSPIYQQMADLMIAQLALIGVEATAYILPQGAAFALKSNGEAPDMLLAIASPDAAHPENQVKPFYTKDGPVNFYGRTLPEAEALVERAGTLTNITERNALYEQAGKLYFDAGQVIPLVDADDVVVHAKGLKGLGLRPVFPPGNIDFATVTW